MQGSKLYIFTIPKSGTYFLAQLAFLLGWEDTGLHVDEEWHLDTFRQSTAENARLPIAVLVDEPQAVTLARVQQGQSCFGHLSPHRLSRRHCAEFNVLACRRRPRDAVVAEFVDFRFRREDHWVRHLSRAAIPDDRMAFVEYLRRNGPDIAEIAANYVLSRDLYADPGFTGTRRAGGFLDVAFESLVVGDGSAAVRRIADWMGRPLSDAQLARVLEAARGADNKTKSVGERIPVDRAALWTPEAETEYVRIGFPELSRQLGYDE